MKENIGKYGLYGFFIIYITLSVIIDQSELAGVSLLLPFSAWAKYAWLPALLAGGFIGWGYSRLTAGEMLPVKTALIALISAFLLLFMAKPYLNAINRNFGERRAVVIEGEVMRKFTAAGSKHAKRKIIEVHDSATETSLQFNVSIPIFQTLEEGGAFTGLIIRRSGRSQLWGYS